MSKLFNGKNALITTAIAGIVVALATFAIPKGWSWLADQLSPPVEISTDMAPLTNAPLGEALPAPLTPNQFADLLTSLDNYDPNYFDQHGYAYVQDDTVNLVIRGNRSHKVVVLDIRAKIIKRVKAYGGFLFYTPPQGASTNPVVEIDLGGPSLSVRESDITDYKSTIHGAPHFLNKRDELADGEVSEYTIIAHADSQFEYDWSLLVDLEVDGVRTTREVQSPHGPYHLTGFANTYSQVYDPVGHQGQLVTDPATICLIIGPCTPN